MSKPFIFYKNVVTEKKSPFQKTSKSDSNRTAKRSGNDKIAVLTLL
jgi:hypothetical protein